jgi:hypothetical protein
MSTTPSCMSTATQTVVDSTLCIDAQPSTVMPCNEADIMPCPQYEWRAGAWGECESFCGPSVQNRTVQCFNTKPMTNMVSYAANLEMGNTVLV